MLFAVADGGGAVLEQKKKKMFQLNKPQLLAFRLLSFLSEKKGGGKYRKIGKGK